MTHKDVILQDGAYDTALAIVGMSGRFPGADDIQSFWRNVINGVVSIRQFSEQELLDAGLDPELIRHPQYVRAGTVLDGIKDFDASFFGFTPREAECLDPQHRLFLECAWEALEQAGYPPDSYAGLIGVFAGSHPSDYREQNLAQHKHLLELVGKLQVSIGNDCDALASMVSYKMNLKGPGVSVQTFCSTSLVATHLACQSLLTYDCDLALAGGAALMLPQPAGYIYEEGGILAPDGQCRTFDGQSQGSVMGSGVGVVALKRLKEAIEDGDHVYAVIRGSAINNDGSVRVGYTAPGLNGQSAVIADAIAQSGVPFESIGYIEAHGTGTRLGDAIELGALLKAFGTETSETQFCALGSAKPNIGHLDRASGVTSLMKTAMSLYHKQLPPSLNFERTSADVHLEASPFYVNTRLRDWQPGSSGIRRAGVNSFGLGGTNAHVVLEEAPERDVSAAGRTWKVLPLAARSRAALSAMATRLADYLNSHSEFDLNDVAYTLQVGRSPFLSRQTVVCCDREEAIALLRAAASGPAVQQSSTRRPVHLFFPDNTEIVQKGWELSAQETHLQEILQEGSLFVHQQFKCSLTNLLEGKAKPERVQCASLLWSYGLAQLLQKWGVEVRAVGGAGAGSLTALVVAGVLSLEDGLRIVLASAQGANEEALVQTLESSKLNVPGIRIASAIRQGWLSKTQVCDPRELAQHLSSSTMPITTLLDEGEAIVLEVGARSKQVQELLALTESYAEQPGRVLTFFSSTMSEPAQKTLLKAVGALWEQGAAVSWKAFSSVERRLRVPLPTYPFERQQFWIGKDFAQKVLAEASDTLAVPVEVKTSRDDWFYVPAWKTAALAPVERPSLARAYLVLLDRHAVGEKLAKRLERRGARVIRVIPQAAGTEFAEESDGRVFHLDRTQRGDYLRLFERLAELGTQPEQIIHCSSLTIADEIPAGATGFQALQERALYTLLFLLQAYEQQTGGAALRVTLFSNQVQSVTGNEVLWPEKSPVLGLAKVAAQENPDVLCRCIDLENLPETEQEYEQLLAEVLTKDGERVLAYRQGQRWSETYIPKKITAPTSLPIRSQGVYLITGGLGGVGLLLARDLAQRVQARLVLVGRTALPPRAEWDSWLEQNGPDNVTSKRIRQVQALEALGSEVLLCQADVADTAQMRAVIEQATSAFGRLHGVIHAAGISNDRAFGSVQELGRDIYDWHFGPKVHGLYALEEVLRGQELDFCVLFSSLSTVLGGLGLAAYTAANRFMDAFATSYNRRTTLPWICVNWDSWHVKERPHGDLGATIAVFTMDHEEGADAFMRVLTSGAKHLVHSTGDLDKRIKQWIYLESLDHSDTGSQGDSSEAATPIPADYERILTEIWKQTLGLEQVSLTDNFFDLGGNSLTALQLISRIRKKLQVQLPAVAIFEMPTISTMVEYLKPKEDEESREQEMLTQRRVQARQGIQRSDIAIIGMSGRFPGASNIDEYWQNLHDGIEALTHFTEEELLASGLDPALVNNPAYVRSRPILKKDEVETFDAAFFGYSPREAELTDPQHRLFLECCWEALEIAGYDAERYSGLIGLFGGTNISSYILALTMHPELLDSAMDYQLVIGNDKDSLATGISYKMNLKGPSLSIQTFCSTSLVATHLACQSLLNGECDLALSGGVSLRIPSNAGYLYQEGGQESTDGHCYTFDARATGSNFGDGAGVVVLKRLADALADGDTIHAVIKGSAINNDGSLKVSYTAPSVNGQAEVVLQALEHAGVSAESISYVEAHGTATELGDPIEVASLTKAYRSHTRLTNFCAIGSAKTNVGHMDRASGVSGLIKVVESLKHRAIPASLNFETPNPAIDFANSPFYVNTNLTPWPRYSEPRRAGINSLGMGGTNAHVIVEEAPEVTPSGPSRPVQILPISARTSTALQATGQRLRAYLQTHEEVPLPDVAYTLQIGRKQMEQRAVLVCRSREDALAQLDGILSAQEEKRTDRPVAFLFSGVGEQYAGMAGDLYEREPVFRECIDHCCTYLRQRFQLNLLPLFTEVPAASAAAPELDLRAMLGRGAASSRFTRIADPVQAQCGTFILEYALTHLLRSWGVRPQALLGYSLGEYIAATVAGVFSLEDALGLVVQRARLVESLVPSGGMLAVFAATEQVQTFLQPGDGVEIAIFTSPGACVLAGPEEGLAAISVRLDEAQIVNRRIENDRAFHSSHMDAVREQLTQLVEAIPRQVPAIPYLSNVSGEWITGEQVQDASYWAHHLCEPVRFSRCVEHLLNEGEWLLLEIGIGQLLCGAVKQHPACTRERAVGVIATLPSIYEQRSTQEAMLRSLGQLWLHGARIDWSGFASRERRQRVPLPTYPFERQRYWLLDRLKGRPAVSTERMITGEMDKIENLSDWFFLPTWTQMPWPLPTGAKDAAEPWLLFMDTQGVGEHIRERLLQRGNPVITVYPGSDYTQRNMREFQVRPTERDDYTTLFQTLNQQGLLPGRLVHCWSVTESDSMDDVALSEHGFYSLLGIAQALGSLGNQQFQIDVISTDMQDVTGNETLTPIKALLTGPCKVIQQEYSHIRCRSIDLAQSELSPRQGDALFKELLAPLTDTSVALRGRHRWVQTYEPIKLGEARSDELPLRQGGVYLIIGGLGGIGLALAEHLARTVEARLVLVGRSGLPPRSMWEEILQTQGSETGIGRRIHRVQVIESLGAQVLPIAANVADEVHMQAVVDLTLTAFGQLNGVIHAAALPPSGLIQLKAPAQAAAVLAPKVQGTLVLERVLAKQELDFLLLFSSMSSSTGGGPGQVDYCAANAFLDSFAHQHSNDYGMTIAINWGEWLWDAWADGLEGFPPEVRRYFINKRRDYGISFEEGMEAMTRILARRLNHVVVATQDFPGMVEGSKSFSIDAIMGAVTTLRKMQSTAYPRPVLSTSYTAPETELEEEIARIWGELLGIEQIGIHDNFFELGGHSLIGSQLIAHLRQRFQVNLSLELIFESATVAELAAAVELALIEEIERANVSTVA